MLDREMGGMNRRWCRALFRSRKGAATASWLGRGPDRCRALRIQSTPQHVGKSANVASQSPPPVNEGLWPHRARYVARDVPEKLAGNLSNGHGSLAQHIDWVDDLRVTKPIACHPAALDTHVDSAGTRALDEPTSAFGKRRAEIAVLKPAIEHEALVELQVADCRQTECHIAAVRAERLDARPVSRAIGGFHNADGVIEAQTCSLDAVGKDAPREGYDLRIIAGGPGR